MRRVVVLLIASTATALCVISAAGATDGPPIIAVGVPTTIPAPVAGSTLLECDAAAVRVELTSSTHLDPTCVWTAGFDITASNVVLDCQGAVIRNSGGGRGVEISSPTDTPMTGVAVRNCRIDGFLNNLRITRPGFRNLVEGTEYANGLTGVVIEHNEFRNSHGVGVFVDGYVSDAIIRNNIVEGTGSAGIYLETGSRRTTVNGNRIHNNGYGENGPNGQVDTFSGLRFRWWGIGREGVAIDGSYENVVTNNTFEGNSHGGILLYTNCGEFPESGRWFDRRWPSDRNHIEGNSFTGGLNGIWVGQRMSENTLPMECTKPKYVDEPLLSITRDFAADNTIVGNAFHDVTYPIRVEDDGTTIVGNTITSDDPNHHGIIVGTQYRTEVLGEPVERTTIRDNEFAIAGNSSPLRWIHGYKQLVVTGNTSHGAAVGICEGQQPPRLSLIWVIAAAFEPFGAPETPAPADLSHPVLGALESCTPTGTPAVIAGAASVTEGGDPAIVIPVTLSHPSDQTVTAVWATPSIHHPSWASIGTDIGAAGGTVEFEPGEMATEVVVPLIDDDVAEPTEWAGILVSDPTNARIGGWWGIGIGIITDDDG